MNKHEDHDEVYSGGVFAKRPHKRPEPWQYPAVEPKFPQPDRKVAGTTVSDRLLESIIKQQTEHSLAILNLVQAIEALRNKIDEILDVINIESVPINYP